MNHGAPKNQEPGIGSDTDNLPELKAKAAQDHDKVIRIHGVYTSFIAAAAVAVIAANGHTKSDTWAFSLWVWSLPCLASFLLLDFIVRVAQQREKSASRGLMLGLGYGLSNVGTAVILTSFSWISAVIYLVFVLICIFLIRKVVCCGREKGCEIL